MNRETNGATRVCNATSNGLTDPPRCVCREFETLAPVKLFDGMHQTQVAFLNQVKKRQTRCLIFFGDRNNETQVGLHELTLGLCAIALIFAQLAATVWSERLVTLFELGCRFFA